MSTIYTTYDKDTLEIQSNITTSQNISSLLSDNQHFLIDNLNSNDHYITTVNGITYGKMKEEIPVEIVTLSCYADLSYNTILRNIPIDTEVHINDTSYGILTASEDLELSLDTVFIYNIKHYIILIWCNIISYYIRIALPLAIPCRLPLVLTLTAYR